MYSKLRKTLRTTGVGLITATCLLSTSLASASVPGTFPVSATSAAAAAESPFKVVNQSYDIVVLGDSLAAGYQKGFTKDSEPYGFAEHVYEQALMRGNRAEFSNYGILGLRTPALNKWLTAAVDGKTATVADVQPNLADPRAADILAQTDKLIEDLSNAELVLISIGGNDFMEMVNSASSTTAFSDLSVTEKSALEQDILNRIDNYKNELSSVFKTVLELQPEAKIVIANQYLPVPFLTFNDQITYMGLPQSTALFLKEGQAKLNAELESLVATLAADGANITLADAATAVEKNIIGYTTITAKDENGNPEPDIHPTASGYAEMGKAYSNAIWGSYLNLQPRKAGVPISVVVGGKEVVTDYAPVIKQGRTFLSLRDVTDALGADLQWDAKTSTATISTGGKTVAITVGANTITVDGKKVPLNAEPAYLQQFPGEKKTYVPLAALSEGLGFQVVYRASLKAAFINS